MRRRSIPVDPQDAADNSSTLPSTAPPSPEAAEALAGFDVDPWERIVSKGMDIAHGQDRSTTEQSELEACATVPLTATVLDVICDNLRCSVNSLSGMVLRATGISAASAAGFRGLAAHSAAPRCSTASL